MNRYDKLKENILIYLDKNTHGLYKRDYLSHMFHVETLSILLSSNTNLNSELCKAAALLHDISIPVLCNDFNHANLSSEMALNFLKDYNETEKEIIIITIKNHSNKDIIDDKYSELLKDADSLAHKIEGHLLKDIELKRIDNIKL